MLAQVLGWFSAAELKQQGAGTALRVHWVGEALRGAFADRMFDSGDTDFVSVDTERLVARDRLAAKKALSHPDKTRSVKAFAGGEHGTHAIVVADAAGNIVSLTTTVNTGFGADKWTKPLGVVHPPNRARPFLRPVSSMTPTIVLRAGKPVIALGGSGGMRIAPNVVQVLLASLVDGLAPGAAVAAPRFRPGFGDFSVALEPGFASEVAADLVKRGEIVKTDDASASAVQLLGWDEQGLQGAGDPRKSGAAFVQ
jgi:gamma-glutamyltranspeptidase/glutathione hydrolase